MDTEPLHESRRRTPAPLMAVALLAAAVLALAGCGGSSKPGYCSDRSTLEQSVKDLGSVDLFSSGGVKQLQSQLQKIQTDARALQSSAKSDFPTESSAITSSASALQSAVQGLGSSPSRQQLVTVAADVKGLATAFQSFKSATNSKCS